MAISRFGVWEIECDPSDGGRFAALRWQQTDLLTPRPVAFRPPARDYGAYERRPVYGYDDCFPTVDPCRFPGLDWQVPDHGELCWQPWQVSVESIGLSCVTEGDRLPVRFTRAVEFRDSGMVWRFAVENRGSAPLPFLHVMHALLPVDRVTSVRLPEFDAVVDEQTDRSLALGSPAAVERFLLSRPRGTATMLLIRGLREGRVQVTRSDGVDMTIEFPVRPFPTLGVWWNRDAYPDEDGCRRLECAFEPLSGAYSSLARSHALGGGLTAPAGGSLEWEVRWHLSRCP